MEVGVFGIFAIIAIVGALAGPSMWGDIFSLGIDTIRIIGCWITIISIVYLIFFAIIVKAIEDGKGFGGFLSVIGATVLCACLFFFFCYLDIVPGMPQTEAARTIYGWLSLGLLIGGGVSGGGGIIIVIFIG